MLVDMSEKLQSDIVYAGSGYNNFHTAVLGGKIKYSKMGAPELEKSFIQSEEDLAKLNLEDIDNNEIIRTVMEALRRTKEKIRA